MSAKAPWNDSVFVIAEIGCNHNGDMALAARLIDAAADAGANAAKFQTFDPQEMATSSLPKAVYQAAASDPGETQFERLCRVRVSEQDHRALLEHCESRGLLFCSSPFDLPSALLLHSLDVPFYKIPSGEITNLPLLRAIAAFGKPMLISTGMADAGEIADALDAIGPGARQQAVLLHCVSNYPASWEDANLRAIQTLRDQFARPVGFSDHTLGIELALVAVGLGAVVIEKHLTLDKTMEGGDHRASLEPGEFGQMVRKIRAVEQALGDGVKRCMPSEEDVKAVARKSLVAQRSIAAGETLDETMVGIKRPGTGIPPKELPALVGRTTRTAVAANDLLKWSDLS